MTQAQETTTQRVQAIIQRYMAFYAPEGIGPRHSAAVMAGQEIAAELDAKDAEIARLTAEVAALKPEVKGWETLRALYEGQGSSIEYAYSMACVARAHEVHK